MAKAQNILSRQRGAKWSLELRQLTVVKREMKAIGKVMTGSTGSPDLFKSVADQLTKDVSALGILLRDKIRFVAKANDVPRRVQRAVFTFSDPQATRNARRKRTALVGVRKGAPPYTDASLYREWNGTGKTIGMSLATIFEKGTKGGPKIRGKYYFMLSVCSMRASLQRQAVEMYKKAVDTLNRAKSRANLFK